VAHILCISQKQLNPLPALEVLGHLLHIIDFDPHSLANAPRHEFVVLDCRNDLPGARSVARILKAANWSAPVLLVVSEGGLPAINSEWGEDFVLESASLAEVDTRLRMLRKGIENPPVEASSAALTIDEKAYSARINGRSLDLTYKEFELLRYLNSHPSQVFSREQLLSEVWGYDYFGGTRTVDVHIRRLRAKLGEFEGLIGTVRNVGYRLDPLGNSES
jgi:DNA-binding response OmpR family regulator